MYRNNILKHFSFFKKPVVSLNCVVFVVYDVLISLKVFMLIYFNYYTHKNSAIKNLLITLIIIIEILDYK